MYNIDNHIVIYIGGGVKRSLILSHLWLLSLVFIF